MAAQGLAWGSGIPPEWKRENTQQWLFWRKSPWDHGEVDGADTFTYVCDENNSKIIFYFKEDGNEVISFTKNSNTSITVYNFFDSIEYWFKQN